MDERPAVHGVRTLIIVWLGQLVIVRMATTAFALFVYMSAFGCMLGGGVIGSAEKAGKNREVANFTQLELLGVGRVEATIGNLRPLELSGDDNILLRSRRKRAFKLLILTLTLGLMKSLFGPLRRLRR